jgi:serine/threonine protein phosphatase PrpC
MKLSPSKQQLEYLESVGVFRADLAKGLTVGPDKLNAVGSGPARPVSGRSMPFFLWLLMVVLGLIFLLLAKPARPATFDTIGVFDSSLSAGPIDNTAVEAARIDPNTPTIRSIEHFETAAAFNEAIHREINRLAVYFALICLGILILKIASERYFLSVTLSVFSRSLLWTERQRIVSADSHTDDLFRSESLANRSIPHRPRALSIMAPEHLLDFLKRRLKRRRWSMTTPDMPAGPWSLGYATHTGNVRSENQDYVTGFRYCDRNVLIVADGMGGLRHGREASFIAVQAASLAVIASLSDTLKRQTSRLEYIARAAVKQAHIALATESDRLNVREIDDGLRTTLIVIIAHGAKIGYAYIGDGGGWIFRAGGDIEPFLIPQKHENIMNVLSASLGPIIQGEMVSGTIERAYGDVIIACTDGIADRVDAAAFITNLVSAGDDNGGDLHSLSARVVNELAAAKDAAGYICDDNLTIGFIGTGDRPMFLNTLHVSNPSEEISMGVD